MKLSGRNSTLRAKLAAVAQEVYDEWDEADVDTYAGGGICHFIADAMCSVLDAEGVECTSVSAQCGEVHVFVVARGDDGVFSVDIPPYTYEEGGGYTWTKIPDVEFSADDVIISKLDADPSAFEQYTEDW